MKYLKIAPFPSPFSRWSHSTVFWKKSSLIIGIVDQLVYSASQSCPILSANCRFNLLLFRLFRGDSSGIDRSSSATCLLYSDVVKGEQCPTQLRKYQYEDEEEAVSKKATRSWRFSFHKYFTTFFYYFFFSITLLYHVFFYTFFYPQQLPTTHDPRPLSPTTLLFLLAL